MPFGERVSISSMADGSPFSADSLYNVAMTSYRAAGGGSLLQEGAGISADDMDSRIVARHPEIRDILYDYLQKNGAIRAAETCAPSVIGHWEFVPSSAIPALRSDMELMFGK